MPRTDIPAGWDERTVLTTFLDYVRATVHAKCEDLAEADARRAPLPGSPLMTLAGLVNHLRWIVDRGGSRPGDAHRRGGSDRPAAGRV